METPTAAAPLTCYDCGGKHHAKGYCKQHYEYRRQHGVFATWPEHPIIPTGVVTLAMLGIWPGQPPTDPGLTPKRVRAIGNANLKRATVWLLAHGQGVRDTLALAVWEPARLDERRRAA